MILLWTQRIQPFSIHVTPITCVRVASQLEPFGWLVWWLCTASLRLSFFPISLWHCFMIFLLIRTIRLEQSECLVVLSHRSMWVALPPIYLWLWAVSLLTCLTSKSDNLQKVTTLASTLAGMLSFKIIASPPRWWNANVAFWGRRRLEQSVQPRSGRSLCLYSTILDSWTGPAQSIVRCRVDESCGFRSEKKTCLSRASQTQSSCP